MGRGGRRADGADDELRKKIVDTMCSVPLPIVRAVIEITSEEFDEVRAEIGRALDDLNVPEREKQEVLAAIVARKDEVVHQSQ